MTKIKNIVSGLAKKYNLTTVPFDVEKLANALGAVIKRDDFDENLSGFAYHKAGSKFIGVNSSESEARQRFTIAHEIGHLILHDKDDLTYDKGFIMLRDLHSSDGTDQKEIAANKFAAELLMPQDMILEDVRGYGALDLIHQDEDTNDFINFMADKYGVSFQAMFIRLTTLYFNA